jgi:hypothetical protein
MRKTFMIGLRKRRTTSVVWVRPVRSPIAGPWTMKAVVLKKS